MGELAPILEAAQLLESIMGMGAAVLPPMTSHLQGKSRSMTVTVFNQTQYVLSYEADYFDSGRFDQSPTNVNPFSSFTFSVCDKDGSVMCGATGGVMFKLQAPKDPANISIGFCAPYLGPYKISALFGNNAEVAYNKAEEGTFKETSGTHWPQFSIDIVSASGQKASITITQRCAD